MKMLKTAPVGLHEFEWTLKPTANISFLITSVALISYKNQN